jgi:hypothetical protein
MQEQLNLIHWSALQTHLPMIACAVALVPILMLLQSNFLRANGRKGGRKGQSGRVLSNMRDENGHPVYVNAFGQPIEQPAVSKKTREFERRREAAMQVNRDWSRS